MFTRHFDMLAGGLLVVGRFGRVSLIRYTCAQHSESPLGPGLYVYRFAQALSNIVSEKPMVATPGSNHGWRKEFWTRLRMLIGVDRQHEFACVQYTKD